MWTSEWEDLLAPLVALLWVILSVELGGSILPPLDSWRKEKVAIYLRTSRQRGRTGEVEGKAESTAAQRKTLRTWAESQPKSKIAKWKIFDEGVWSGTEANRPVRAQLLQEVFEGKWSKVVVLTVDRWSRDWKDAGRTLELMSDVGVPLYDKSNDFESGVPAAKRPRDELLMAVFFGLATEFVGSATIKTEAGQRVAEVQKGRARGPWPTLNLPWRDMGLWVKANAGGDMLARLVSEKMGLKKRKDPKNMRKLKKQIMERQKRGIYDDWVDVVEAINAVEEAWRPKRGGADAFKKFRQQFKGWVTYPDIKSPLGTTFPTVTPSIVLDVASQEHPEWFVRPPG